MALILRMLTRISVIFSLAYVQINQSKSPFSRELMSFPARSSAILSHWTNLYLSVCLCLPFSFFFNVALLERVHNVGCVQLHIHFKILYFALPIPNLCKTHCFLHDCCCTISLQPSTTNSVIILFSLRPMEIMLRW